MKIPVIIDTDPGIDDFFALMVAAASDKLDIRAITAVAGNQAFDKVCKNALDISDYLGIDAPVAKGAQKPMIVPQKMAGEVHGSNGLGEVVLPKNNRQFCAENAWDLMYRIACEQKGKLHIIAIGPLTNLAIAFLKYEDLPGMLAGVTIMGGSATFGNHSQYAEFNIWADPHAAGIVFGSGVKVDMFGLNATQQTRMNISDFKTLTCNSRISEGVDKLIAFMEENGRKRGRDTFTMHDAVAVAYLIDPSIACMESSYVVVECRSEHSLGQTVVFSNNRNRIYDRKDDNANVAVSVDLEKFKNILKDSFNYFKKREV